MDKQPGNKHWLQNNNDRPPTRPGPPGRPNPNGQTPQKGPGSNINRWLLLIVGIMLVVYIYNYFSATSSTSTTPQALELSYTDFYAQINNKNIKSATFIGQTE